MKTQPRSLQPPLVSIIIPVYNKWGLTAQCLRAISEVTKHIAHEIIVVDNASTDATASQMQRQAPNLRYLRNEVNRNFSGACNQGAAAAKGRYLLFLNNDTIPLSGWLDPLLEEVRQHPEVAVVGSKLLYESGQVQHAGVAFARETRSPMHIHRMLRLDDSRVNRRREMQAVTAACFLIRPKWFNDCGGFSEDFRNGYEDLDLCLKIRRRGGLIVYQPLSTVIHLESQTPNRMKHDNENRALFFQRWQHALLSDEDMYYFADGCYRAGLVENRPEAPQLVRLSDNAERAQWQRVADCQALGARWKREDLIQALTQAGNWPSNAPVRLWLGCLCRRLGLVEQARAHFSDALALENSPQTRLLLSEICASSAANEPADISALEHGSQALRMGNFDQAREAFERALIEGAAPSLALAGLWRAGRRGAKGGAAAELVSQALHNLPRIPGGKHFDVVPSSITSPQNQEPPGLVSIIILVLNQLDHTRACLESISRHTPQPHEVIVVDNGSTDGTPEFLRQWQAKHPNCSVIRNNSNRGFAGGNNQGLALARGDYVLLLNNDTVVTDNWLAAMLAVITCHPETGIVGPVSNRVSGPQLVSPIPYRNLTELQEFAARHNLALAGQSLEVSRAVGFCLLATRAVIDKIGGLDERFGQGNFEDDDFCIRVRLAGLRIRIARDSFVHHVGSQTFLDQKIDYTQSIRQNWDIFRRKWAFPSSVTLETGYPIPQRLPQGTALKIPVPPLAESHVQDGRWWNQINKMTSISPKVALPLAATLGDLTEARASFARKDLATARSAAQAAVNARPFHPDGLLLLGEIALARGETRTAKELAQRAHELTPSWNPVRRFVNDLRKIKCPSISDQAIRLSVCIIAKNEEKQLPRCLQSVQGLASQIIVVDTGSTDRTVEIALAAGAEVFHFKWCDDFSAARNAALEHARGDWVLILDADEELPKAQHERLKADLRNRKFIALRLPLVNKGQEAEGRSYVPRLFRNAPGLYFTGRIHEQVFPSLVPLGRNWGLSTGLGTAEILHHGYSKEAVTDRNKIQRNLGLLRLAVQECPEDANLAMNLGLELVRSGDLEDGLHQYRRAFELMTNRLSDDLAPELTEALLTQFTCHLYKASALDEVVEVLNSPLAKRKPLTSSLHFALGLALFGLGRHLEAAEQMNQCLSRRGQPALTPINTDILTAAPHHCLAMSLRKAGDFAAAEKAFQAALPQQGRNEEVRLDYARFLLELNRPVEALQCLHDFVAGHPQSASSWHLGGQIALSRADFLEFACDWTSEAVQHVPDDSDIMAQRAEALLLNLNTEQARDIWQSLWHKQRPPRAAAALIICELMVQQACPGSDFYEPDLGDISRAFIDWYQRALAMRAQSIVSRINEQLEALRSILPAAANMLEAALNEAGAESPANQEACLA